MDIPQLSQLWEQEKDQYQFSEIGTGVQKYVKHVFECKDIFNIVEGKLSTQDAKRKNEFLTEAKKKGRRADVVIFIDADIVIPVEIEKHTHIKQGVEQIYNYQNDWIKKYGILTDGNEWWFYNNRFVIKIFTINDMLKKTKEFITFWKEYTTPDYYYSSFFENKQQNEIFETPTPQVDAVRQDFFIDITNLIENFEHKLNLKGYFINEKDEVTQKKKAVEITYAYLIQFVLYKVLVDNSFSDFDKDWKDRLDSIGKAIKAESYGGILVKIKGISNKISEKIYKRFNDEQLAINNKLQQILDAPKNEIGDVSAWLDIILFIGRYDFSSIQNEIFGFVYENYLKDLYLDEKKGQYFTDPNVVEFMLNEMGYTCQNLKKRYAKEKESISIIDPSCGSGTFLYNATNRLIEAFFDDNNTTSKLTEQIINENVFGLDIAEFPLYLAEMNILMRMLPVIINELYNNPIDQKIKIFKTNDSIAEFLDTSIKNTLSDINVAFKKQKNQLDLFSQTLDLGYDSFMRDKGDLSNLKNSLENLEHIPRTRFDFVVGNPPYISYNECAGQNILSFVLMREGKLKLNDIYGVNLHSIPTKVKKYRPNPNLYAFFMALGIGLLKDDGVISYIIPQTLLNAGDLDVLRYHLAKFTSIDKIIVFANNMFIGRGLKQNKPVATSSLIFIIRKTPPKHNHNVEVIKYSSTDKEVAECLKDIAERKNTENIFIANKILLKNVENWNFIKFSEKLIDFFDAYNSAGEHLNTYYEHKLADEIYQSRFYFDGGYSIDESKRLYQQPNEEHYIYPKFQNTTYTKVTANGYWLNQRNKNDDFFIGLRQGSQEYNLLDSTYKIVWSYANPSRFYFIDERIIWARNQFNAIGSENYNELLYLFALLNAPINLKIFRESVKSENEKDMLLSITSIKALLKTPIITTDNQMLKNEIINVAKELIELEKKTLSSYIDFKGLLLQKYEKIGVMDDRLELSFKGKEYYCNINDKLELVKSVVININKTESFTDGMINSLSELKLLSAIDTNYQTALKKYIDDLVFALYFKIELSAIGFINATDVNIACGANKYYGYLTNVTSPFKDPTVPNLS